MKKLILAILLSLGVSGIAQAGVIATLTSCRMATSVTGRAIYVGTYYYGGQYYEFTFGNYCPATVELN